LFIGGGCAGGATTEEHILRRLLRAINNLRHVPQINRPAALHPRQPLLAFTVDARVRSQLALSWGVETFLVPEVEHTDDMVAQVDFSLLSIGRLKVGDRVVVVAGSPPNTVGSTNLIRVHEVGTDS